MEHASFITLHTTLQIDVSAVVADVTSVGTTTLPQSVRVDFIKFMAADTRQVQAFSGNPGYQTGYPLLVSLPH
jgi:hypothetical protein